MQIMDSYQQSYVELSSCSDRTDSDYGPLVFWTIEGEQPPSQFEDVAG